MPAAINLQKVTVSGWKAIDADPVEIPFNGESWLIYGGNETGKSSTFSAIRAGLFERPDVTGAFADNWVNNQTPNGARIELELLIDGQEFTIVKTRGTTRGNGSTTLYEGWGAGRTQTETGTPAVNEILELIGAKPRGGAGGRDAEQPQNWGILAWLLAPQGMDSVAPAREQGTQTIGLERAVSDEMVQVEEELKSNLKIQLTDGGKSGDRKPVSGGTYKAAIEATDLAATRLGEIEENRGKYTQLLQEITRIENLIKEEKGKLVGANEKIEDLRGAEVDLTGLSGSIKVEQGKIEAKEIEITTAEESITNLKDVLDESNTLMNQLKGFKRDIESTIRKKKGLDAEIKTNTDQINPLTERQQKNSEEIQTKQEQMLAAVADAARIDLQKTLETLDRLEGEQKELLEQGPIVDDDELKKMYDLVSRFDRAESMLNYMSGDMGVSVQLDGKLKADWNIDGLETEVDSETVFAQEMVIQSGDFTLNLKKESTEDTDWVIERNDCISEFKEYSVADSEELRKKEKEEKSRSRSALKLGLRIEAIESRDVIEERLEKLPDQSDGDSDIDVRALQTEIDALVDEKKEFEETIKKLGEDTVPLEKGSTTLGEELKGLRASENATDALAKSAFKRRDKEIEGKGVMATREQRLKGLNAEHGELTKERQRLITQKKTEEDAATDGLRKAIRIKGHIERELIGKRSDLNTLNANADELGGGNLQQAIVDANIAVNDSNNYLERIKHDVRAEERLLDRFIGALNDATEFEIGPIKDQVQIWLGAVTQGKWTQLEMDSKLNVTRIHGPASPPIEGEKVGSAGLKQVIHALIRLAVACKIHDDKSKDMEDFPPVALVMDESQGNVDDTRVLRLVGTFNREIESGRVQVIALSHRRNEFQTLHALNYNVERREVIDQRDAE